MTVRYEPGALDRADQVQRRLTRLVAETGHRNLRQPLVVVELLRAEEWRQSGLAEPYGLPAISGTGSLALPAWGEPETVALWRRLLDGWLPSSAGAVLRGSPEEAASLEGADLVGEVEASRIVLSKLGLTGSEPWVDDLLACALAVSALRRSDPGRWAEVRQFHSRLAARPEASARRAAEPSALCRRGREDQRGDRQAACQTAAQDGAQEQGSADRREAARTPSVADRSGCSRPGPTDSCCKTNEFRMGSGPSEDR